MRQFRREQILSEKGEWRSEVHFRVLHFAMRQVAADGRRRVPKAYPSPDVIGSFRDRYQETTYRKTENKEAAKDIKRDIRTRQNMRGWFSGG